MTIETTKYSRRPFDVEAIRVTKSNMEEVAEWCKGEVVKPETNGGPDTTAQYIQVDVHAPANERQSRAFPGDYVLLLEGGKSFKVYTTKAFNKNFVPATEDQPLKNETKQQKTEPKPANGIKPEAREALRKMGEAREAVRSMGEGAQKDKDETPAAPVEAAQPSDPDKDETPSSPVEVSPQVAAQASESELQVVERPVEELGTTQPKLEVTKPAQEAEKKRKFVQKVEVIDGNG